MKTMKFCSWIFALMLPVTLMGQSNLLPEDDIYYKQGDENPIVQKKHKEPQKQNNNRKTLIVTGVKKVTISDQRDIDEYNGRTMPEEANPAYQDSLNSIPYNEEGEEPGNYNQDSTYQYSERIRKFHNPQLSIELYDPENTDIYLINSSDMSRWNSNYYWNNSYYGYRPYCGFGWNTPYWGFGYGGYSGWYDPWYYGGWYDPWYYGGWYSPYYSYWGYPYGYGGYYGGYYGGGYGGYYSGYKGERFDNGRRPTSNTYGSRDSRYGRTSTDSRVSTRSGETGRYNSSGSAFNGRSSRYTSVPSSRSASDVYSTGGGRATRYSTPANNTGVRSTYNSGATNTYYNNSGRSQRVTGNGTYTPAPSNRTNYSTGSSSNPSNNNSGYSSGRSSSYSTGSSNTRSSYSSPSNSSPSYSAPSSSGSYSSGGRSSSSGSSGGSSSSGSSSGGGGRSSSGGRR